jgi:hypothetical protein
VLPRDPDLPEWIEEPFAAMSSNSTATIIQVRQNENGAWHIAIAWHNGRTEMLVA